MKPFRRTKMKYLIYGVLVLLLMSGCVRRVRHIPIEPVVEHNTTEPAFEPKRGSLYDTSRAEAKYKLKPEPYSVSSKEKDPELLGPQRTIEPVKKAEEVKVATATEPVHTPVPAAPIKSVSTSMTKDACISMIGQTKFDRYSKRFGGESGAIKRCAILKKLKRG
jgi:hypothetical protein